VTATPRGNLPACHFTRFTDVAEAAGLRAPVVNGYVDSKSYILKRWSRRGLPDYDNDGWLISSCSAAPRSKAPGRYQSLYRNNRDGTFSDVTVKAGLQRTGWASAVAVGDYNNDGFDDLFVTYWGQNVLYRNNGDGTFTDVTRQAGLLHAGTRWGSGCTFLDYDRNGKLDLFVANYLEFSFDSVPKPGSSAYCNLERRSGDLRPTRPAAWGGCAVSQQRRRHVHRRERRLGRGQGQGQLHDDRGCGRFQQRRMA
jgi:hypothetical protein